MDGFFNEKGFRHGSSLPEASPNPFFEVQCLYFTRCYHDVTFQWSQFSIYAHEIVEGWLSENICSWCYDVLCTSATSRAKVGMLPCKVTTKIAWKQRLNSLKSGTLDLELNIEIG